MKVTRTCGLLVEPLGPVWVAFSPANGETTLLNDERAAILELGNGALDTTAIVSQLAVDVGMCASALAPVLESHWVRLIGCGLLRQVPASAPSAV